MHVTLSSWTVARLRNLSSPRQISSFRGHRRKDFSNVLNKEPRRRNHQRRGVGSQPKAVVTEFLTVSHVAAATAGFLVALVSTHVLRIRDNTEPEVEQKRDHTLQQRIAELETSLENMQTELDAERQRVVILEKAKSVVVMDVTHALSQKRNAEFALAEAREEIARLKSNTIQQVPVHI